MTPRQLAEILAIFDKLKIEQNPNLSREQKEIMKQFIDEIKRQVPTDARF